jgi:hypothetical protein
MYKKITAVFYLFFICSAVRLFPQADPYRSLRSLADIFPDLDVKIEEKALSPGGYLVTHNNDLQTLKSPSVDHAARSGINNIKPAVVVECLLVIPYPSGPLELVDIYNGLRRVRALGGRLYHSATRNADIPLFENVTRLESARRSAVKEDPPPQSSLPDSETIYIRLKDVNFGNSYYQADIKKGASGFIYTLFNNRDLTYFIIPAIKSGRFVAQFYFEPIDRGVMVYCVSGAEVSGLIASQVDMPSAIQKRLAVIIEWIVDGVSGRL